MGIRTIKFWNFLTRIRRPRCEAGSILILLPSCLQNSECTQKVANSTDLCLRCGRCKIADIMNLADRFGCRVAVATGGRLAMELAGRDHVRAIIAVACEVELKEGLKGVFPKPALGIVNIRPNGPCKDTDVVVEKIENALKLLTTSR